MNLCNDLTALGGNERNRAESIHSWEGLSELEIIAIVCNEMGEMLQAAVKAKDDPETYRPKLRGEMIQVEAMIHRAWFALGFGDKFKATIDERLREVRKSEPYKSHPYLQGVEDEAWEVTAFNEPAWVDDENHITVDGVRYVAVEEYACNPCEAIKHCNKLVCSQFERKDRRNVVWKRV